MKLLPKSSREAADAMLQVEAHAIRDEALTAALGLLEREMHLVVNHLPNLGTQAALISGFVFVLIADEGIWDLEALHPVQTLLTMSLTTICFGAMLYVVVCSTICCSLGPVAAFTGRESSAMRRAVE